MSKFEFDIVVIGAGLVGLATAYQLKLSQPDLKVLILDKEDGVAKHQSGHNSGVIHSGIYYTPGSLKARNCISGYESIIKFAQEHDIPFDICGKIIVATSPTEIPGLDKIYQRGIDNGLRGIRKLSREESCEIEPHCSAIQSIYVPQTGIIDYPKMAEKISNLFKFLGGDVVFNQEVTSIHNNGKIITVHTKQETYHSKKLVSCGGLFSDRIASLTENDNNLRIIPFRGEYYKLKPEKESLVKHLIYPVPNPDFPFLGVHFTRMIGGGIEAGPNAVLAFKREGYNFTDFSIKDMSDTLMWPGFWKIAAKYGLTGVGEIYRSLSKAAFTRSLQKLIPEISEGDLIDGGSGVRAQACDKKGNLIDDFDILQHGNIIHVRNAPSPAATSALSIGKSICKQILN